MFLEKTLNRNPQLIDAAIKFHREGLISPDTYVLDLDSIIYNAKKIKDEADRCGIQLYFMTKQIGRNPYISKEIMKLGYAGAVAVDFREAEILSSNGIQLGNIGHLVQIPTAKVKHMVSLNPEIITVFSVEKAMEISEASVKLSKTQDIMLRVIDKNDFFYSGQYGGFKIEELTENVKKIINLPNIRICGLTSFPCFLYDEKSKAIKETSNCNTIKAAQKLLKERLCVEIAQINLPSITCARNIENIKNAGGTHGEPGHALIGTTPLHAAADVEEIPSIVYVSEISHNVENKSYVYGGGHYRRSHMSNAIVGKSMDSMVKTKATIPPSDNIDYYFQLRGNYDVGDTVIFSFRTQIFVTRSEVAVVKGIKDGNPKLVGVYDSQGKLLEAFNE